MSPIPHVSLAINIFESKAPQCYAAVITTYVLAVGAVALRFWARRLMKARTWVDDWTAAAALSFATGSFVLILVWLQQGFGHHSEVLGKDFATTFGKNFFTGEILYSLTIGAVKISILAFYWRLFQASMRTPCYLLGALTLCWEVAVILGTVFQCVPVSGFWNHQMRAQCFNYKHFLLGTALPHIATDVALLLLPVPFIWRLHSTAAQKIVLAGIFMLGGFVSIISIVRLTILLKLNLHSPDLDYNFVTFVDWSIAESNMAIVAACLPSLRPILSLTLHGTPTPALTRHLAWTRSQPSVVLPPLTSSKTSDGFVTLPDEAYGFSGIRATASADSKCWDHRGEREMRTAGPRAGSGIEVRTEVEVLST